MEINDIAIIVDGPTETGCLEKMFQRFYYKTPAFRYSPGNGLDYTEEMYAKRVVPILIVLLSKNIQSVILIPDLEKRTKKKKTTLGRFSYDIKNCIIREILSKDNCKYSDVFLQERIQVCPSDIMFENWIISDIENIKKSQLIDVGLKQYLYDGQNGSVILSKSMANGLTYKKTVHAKKLFNYVDVNVGITNSPSFNKFILTVKDCLQM